MKRANSTFLILSLWASLFLSGGAQDHDHDHVHNHSHEAAPSSTLLEEQSGPLRLEEAVFEANGAPLYVVNARARVKNLGEKGYRDGKVRFYCRLDASQDWTLVGERPLPGVPPGHSATCDLVTDSEGLPIFNGEGEVSHCQYRVEVQYADGVAQAEGEFHPSCIHDH